MKNYEVAFHAFQAIEKILQTAAVNDDRKTLSQNFNHLFKPLFAKFQSTDSDDERVMHLFSIDALLRIHLGHISAGLSRSNSNISYMRSCFWSSEGDTYYGSLAEQLSKLDRVWLLNSDSIKGKYITPKRLQVAELMAHFSSDNLINTPCVLGPAMIGEGVEPSTSLLQLQKRLVVIGLVNILREQVLNDAKTVTGTMVGVNALSVAAFGPFGLLLGIPASIAASSGVANRGMKHIKEIESIDFGQLLVRWKDQVNEMLTLPESNEAAVALLTDAPTAVNPDIRKTLEEKGLTLKQAEAIWPREKHAHLYDPVSFDFLVDPVLLGTSGHTFNRSSIEEALRHNPGVDPLTGIVTSSTALTPNFALRETMISMIQAYEPQRARMSPV